MNILVSYNWIKEYLKTDLTPAAFAKQTTAAGNSVERMDVLRDRFAKIVVGQIKNVKAHPNATKLRIAEVDIGASPPARGGPPGRLSGRTGVGSGGSVEIVCGGSNLEEGHRVIVALPGAKVRWHGEGDWVELHETEIRGVKSHGMICAANELGFDKLGQPERAIWDVTDLTDAKPGTLIANALELDDVIFDIEVTSNRVDCKSIVGQAREGAAVTGAAFREPKPVLAKAKKGEGTQALNVTVNDTSLCKKYEAIVIDGVTVAPSPWWLQKRLLLAGHRPINNVVDVTNYVLHELGQPLHAFDADKLEGGNIVVRRAKKGESVVALDGKTYELSDAMLVIADAKRPVAIAGVMGGTETATTNATKRIVIESATFDPVSVRRTSRALSLSSDSSQLFEKGLSTEGTAAALSRAVELILDIAGGRVASPVFSKRAKPYKAPHFSFDPAAAQALMGVDVPPKDMLAMLKCLGFVTTKKGKGYAVTVPYWRDHDVEHSRDFVEEIARLYGYTNIPSSLPIGELASASPDPALVWERRVKEILRGAGVTEAYSYSFVSVGQLERYAIPLEQAVTIQNPLTSDLECMRPSLVPSMLTAIEANQRIVPEAALFELGPVYTPNPKDIPDHRLRLLIAVYSKDGESAFRRAKGITERLMREGGVREMRLERAPLLPANSPPARGGVGGGGRGVVGESDARWHAGRSAAIWVGQHDHVGTIGQVSDAVADTFDLEPKVVLIDLDFDALLPHLSTKQSYHPLPLYPEVKRDLAFIVENRTEYVAIERAMKAHTSLLHVVELFDIYRGKGVEAGKKSLAMHLSFRSPDRTLSAEEVETQLRALQQLLEETFHAIMRT